ncbi:hypothetical protein F5Y11DRAFT_336310 [Daldinia sp. FL1419]|nr:hypothetical protein F5Y11DRAFT_336310 [Daldinia sp. FL1419]
MSTAGELSPNVIQPLEGFISDDEDPKTPSMAGESLFDYFPFEEIENLPVINLSVATEPEDLPLRVQWKDPDESRLKSFPQVHRIVDWIMGRNVVIREDVSPAKLLPTTGGVAKKESGERSEVHFNRRQSQEDELFDIGDVRDICPACTTPYCQAIDSLPFKSSLKLRYNDPETHTWLIGDRYVMTEELDDEWSTEADVTLSIATDLVKTATRVPVPNVIAGWKENRKIITITERVPGRRLYDIWWDLEEYERERIAKEVARHIDQWRRMTADRISTVGGGPVRRHGHLFGSTQEGFGPFRSDGQVWSHIHRQLKEKNVSEDLVQILKDYMPESAPCVFTHGDLSTINILIHNGRVTAILGFDNAACLPVWAEHVAVHFCYCQEDEQWKAMLSKHMKSYARAKDWWSLWTAVNKSAPKKEIASLVTRCMQWQKPPQNKRTFDPEIPKEKEQRNITDLNVALPESHLQPCTQSYFHKSYSPLRAALSKKLLKGRNFAELLNDLDWQSPIHLGSEEGDVVRGSKEGSLSAAEEAHIQNIIGDQDGWGVPTKDSSEEEAHEAKRVGIERWLSESERGRSYYNKPLLLQRLSSDTQDTPPQTSPVKDPPWRERQRSFERSDNDSKGLRPFSLPLSFLSGSTKYGLREVKRREESGNEGDAREQSIEKTLRSLETAQDDSIVDVTAIPTARQEEEETRNSVEVEKKRSSIFREKTSPGSLYLTLANAAAEGKSKRYRRSLSQEQAALGEGQATD